MKRLAMSSRRDGGRSGNLYPRYSDVSEANLSPSLLSRLCVSMPGSRNGHNNSHSCSTTTTGVVSNERPIVIHTQIDYTHELVPDILEITNCGFYWGKMDRYEAERLLDKKPEGTFLLRDSAQEEHLFSVSFRRFDRSLHARIEQLQHRFSFDSHDPTVYSSNTVCGLIEHYKNPSHCMFFEPMLTIPLYRSFPFSLQHLSRATISAGIKYDSINHLPLPKRLKGYLKEYHYKQKARETRLD